MIAPADEQETPFQLHGLVVWSNHELVLPPKLVSELANNSTRNGRSRMEQLFAGSVQPVMHVDVHADALAGNAVDSADGTVPDS